MDSIVCVKRGAGLDVTSVERVADNGIQLGHRLPEGFGIVCFEDCHRALLLSGKPGVKRLNARKQRVFAADPR